ncbi:MAG: DUF1566 domain-containing protein [Rhodospirillales bacterium]|nr:DUF1566 domain-containing protein [Rhodospirillales bacterium]
MVARFVTVATFSLLLMSFSIRSGNIVYAQETSATFSGGAMLFGWDGRDCDASLEGALRYNSSTGMEFCALGDVFPTGCPTIGDVCSDGTVYAGLTPDGNVEMYAQRCDAGMSWGGSSCTGTRSTPDWNDGNVTGHVTTGLTNLNTGEANTAALDGLDSNSGLGGVQPHQAAQYCADSSLNDYSDWYLPARAEVSVLSTNYTSIGGFSTGRYWSSTETSFPGDTAHIVFMGSGATNTNQKYDNLPLRCVRKVTNPGTAYTWQPL